MREKQYSFKVTITLEEGDDYTQDEVKEIVEDYLGLGNDREVNPIKDSRLNQLRTSITSEKK
jgi:hypothetical protein